MMETQQRNPEEKTGYIYKLTNENTNDVYIGSTKSKINRRFSVHKNCYNKGYKSTSSYKIFEGVNPKIELIEEYKYIDLNDLRRREGELQKITPNCVNVNVAGRIKTDQYRCLTCNKVIRRCDNIPRHNRSSQHKISEYIRLFHNQ
jgi:hypothetical protein